MKKYATRCASPDLVTAAAIRNAPMMSHSSGVVQMWKTTSGGASPSNM